MAKIYSGLDYIDAVLSYSQQAASPVNSWSHETTVGSAVTLTFDFMTVAPANAPAGGYVNFTTAQRASATAIMAKISEFANITFNFSGNGTADLEFGTVAFGGSPSGFTSGQAQTQWTIVAPPINTYYTHADIYLTNSFAIITDQTVGGAGYATMLHEIGHSLGLAHTFSNISAPAGTDNNQYSVMSYTDHPGSTKDPSTFMTYDIAALQYLYGANTSTRAGADTYSWAANAAVIETIWDGGGAGDHFDASAQTLAATIDLTAGGFSSIGGNGAGGSASNNIGIAYGVVIENATGGSGADTITGNAADNVLIGGSGSDKLFGGAGNDRITYDATDDLANVLGGADTDTLVVIGGSAPVSFDLAAHQFELAEHSFGLGGGASQKDNYNSGWQRTDRTIYQADGSRSETVFDPTNATDTVQVDNNFDTSGTYVSQTAFYDVGGRWSAQFNIPGANDYIYNYFDAADQLDYTNGRFDTGLTFLEDTDQGNQLDWTNKYAVNTASNQADYQYDYYDNGTRSYLDHDQNGAEIYLYQYTFYDASNVVDYYYGKYNDGSDYYFDL